MLFILFQIGTGRFALEAKHITEVLPLMAVRPLPQAPPGVTGVLSYRGTPLPVIDLSQLVLGQPAELRLSTRILVVSCANGRQVGLIAERANETMRRAPEEFSETGVSVPGAPYLGPVTQDARGFVQRVDPEKLVSMASLQSLEEVA
jgi:chemotaxis-related protein WspB